MYLLEHSYWCCFISKRVTARNSPCLNPRVDSRILTPSTDDPTHQPRSDIPWYHLVEHVLHMRMWIGLRHLTETQAQWRNPWERNIGHVGVHLTTMNEVRTPALDACGFRMSWHRTWSKSPGTRRAHRPAFRRLRLQQVSASCIFCNRHSLPIARKVPELWLDFRILLNSFLVCMLLSDVFRVISTTLEAAA